jgi:hypothetical protein
MTLEPGRRATFRYVVTDADTAASVGSGATTVGTRVELDHLAPSRWPAA